MAGAEEFARRTLGSYLPTAFTIKMLHPAIKLEELSTSGPLILPRAAFPTFMHEFAHLIQDWSTFRGIMDFCNAWDKAEAATEHVQACDEVVPFPIIQGKKLHRLTPKTMFAMELDYLEAMTEPVLDWKNDASWGFESYEHAAFGLPLSGRKVEGVFILLNLVEEKTKEKYTHRLGAWEIKEAYSVAVAILHGGKEKIPGKADYEYIIVHRILQHYFDDFTPLHTIALCHWALQDLAPANTLFTLIEMAQARSGRRLPDARTVYDLGREEALGRGFERNAREIVAHLAVLADERQRRGEVHVAHLFRWYHEHAGRLLLSYLDRSRYFPLDTFLCEPSTALSEEECGRGLEGLFHKIHVPLLIWPNGVAFAIAQDEGTVNAVFFNRCVIDLLAHIWRKRKETWPCPVYGGCQLPLKDADDCLNRPWKKGWVEKPCCYGLAAQHLSIRPGKSFHLELLVDPAKGE